MRRVGSPRRRRPAASRSPRRREISGRYIFYNDSYFDGDNPAAEAADDLAIAADKRALLPGETASFANYTSYDKGINGILVDISGRARPVGQITAADFRFRVGNNDDPTGWADAPAPTAVEVRLAQSPGEPDRVAILWADHAIQRQWLQVTVLATPATALAEPDVFYFGNAVGESGNAPGNAIVNATDEILARNFSRGLLNPAAIDDRYDYNRDGLVNGTDQVIARGNQTNPLNMLRLIAAPASDVLMAQSAELPADGASDPIVPESKALADELAWLAEYQRMTRGANAQESGHRDRRGPVAGDRLALSKRRKRPALSSLAATPGRRNRWDAASIGDSG